MHWDWGNYYVDWLSVLCVSPNMLAHLSLNWDCCLYFEISDCLNCKLNLHFCFCSSIITWHNLFAVNGNTFGWGKFLPRRKLMSAWAGLCWLSCLLVCMVILATFPLEYTTHVSASLVSYVVILLVVLHDWVTWVSIWAWEAVKDGWFDGYGFVFRLKGC